MKFMPKRNAILLKTFICLFAWFLPLFQSSTFAQDSKKLSSNRIRIGVYDSRSIAIAYAASKYNPVSAKMKEYKIAEEKGDKKKMEQLQKWGKDHQRQLHRQGFGVVPVTDLLDHVKKEISNVAKKANVVAISRTCDFHFENVELIDVTAELVELFEPSEKTRKMANSIRDKPAVDLNQLDSLDHKK